jgi:transcriptional regulator with XRE-family HTH domain
MGFGENLKSLRKEKGITQEELAEWVGVSRQAVSKWESDSGYPEADKLLILAEKIGVSLDDLMRDKLAGQGESHTITLATNQESAIVITVFDGSQTVRCLSVRYSKILFHGKNEPAYLLLGVDHVGLLGEHSVTLGWYEDEETVKKEIAEIQTAIKFGNRTYQLKYFVDVKFTLLGLATRK